MLLFHLAARYFIFMGFHFGNPSKGGIKVEMWDKNTKEIHLKCHDFETAIYHDFEISNFDLGSVHP